MVIDNLHIPSRSIAPDEADSELVVDANAPLPDTIARELLQPVLWRHAQGLDACGGMYHLKLSKRHGGKVGETGHTRPVEQGFGIPALERLNHRSILTQHVSIVKNKRCNKKHCSANAVTPPKCLLSCATHPESPCGNDALGRAKRRLPARHRSRFDRHARHLHDLLERNRSTWLAGSARRRRG